MQPTLPNEIQNDVLSSRPWYKKLANASKLRRIGLFLALAGCAPAPRLTSTPEMGNSLDGTQWSADASKQRAGMTSSQIVPPITLPPSTASPSVPAPQAKSTVDVKASRLLASPNTIANNNSTLPPPQDPSSLGDGMTENGDGESLNIGRLLKATKLPVHQLNFLNGMRRKLGAVAACMEQVDKQRDNGDQFSSDAVDCFIAYKDACLGAAETLEGKSACVDEYNRNADYMRDMAEKALSFSR